MDSQPVVQSKRKEKPQMQLTVERRSFLSGEHRHLGWIEIPSTAPAHIQARIVEWRHANFNRVTKPGSRVPKPAGCTRTCYAERTGSGAASHPCGTDCLLAVTTITHNQARWNRAEKYSPLCGRKMEVYLYDERRNSASSGA